MEKPELFSTSESEGHIHIVYKNANGEYECYENNDHIHFVRKVDAVQIKLDNEGNVER